jgi:hypothetical protein
LVYYSGPSGLTNFGGELSEVSEATPGAICERQHLTVVRKERTLRIQEKICENRFARCCAHPRYGWNFIGRGHAQERQDHEQNESGSATHVRTVVWSTLLLARVARSGKTAKPIMSFA